MKSTPKSLPPTTRSSPRHLDVSPPRRRRNPRLPNLEDWRTPALFLDESGSKSSAGKFFTIGLIKTYLPGKLSWEIRNICERLEVHAELKFTKVTKDTFPAYIAAIEALRENNVLIGAFNIEGDTSRPGSERPAWKAHADQATRLVKGILKPDELATVVMDIVTTPRGISLAQQVKSQVNHSVNGLAVISGIDADSQAYRELQLADLVAGIINYDRRSRRGALPPSQSPDSLKAQLVRYAASVFEVPNFEDTRARYVNIHTAIVRNY